MESNSTKLVTGEKNETKTVIHRRSKLNDSDVHNIKYGKLKNCYANE